VIVKSVQWGGPGPLGTVKACGKKKYGLIKLYYIKSVVVAFVGTLIDRFIHYTVRYFQAVIKEGGRKKGRIIFCILDIYIYVVNRKNELISVY
jgi:hypothetical protein